LYEVDHLATHALTGCGLGLEEAEDHDFRMDLNHGLEVLPPRRGDREGGQLATEFALSVDHDEGDATHGRFSHLRVT
jgi:hypothetical protein